MTLELPSPPQVLLLFSLRRELQSVLRGWPLVPLSARTEPPVYAARIHGADVLASYTGMGPSMAAAAARSLANDRIGWIVSIGFAGALWDELALGDIVLASEVADVSDGERNPASSVSHRVLPLTAEGTLLQTRLRVITAGILTVNRAASSAAEKAELSRRAPFAAAVDMESAAVVRAAREAGIPCSCVRGITDTAREGVPDTLAAALDPATGDPLPLKLSSALIRSPRLLPRLVRLGRGASLAARNLAAFVEAYVAALADGSAEPPERRSGAGLALPH